MGYRTEFNWALKLKPEQGLDENNLQKDKEYKFEKDDERIYPLDIPIHLINDNWEVIAKIIIKQFTVSKGKTRGIYEVVRIYEGEEKETLTENFRETLEVVKGKKFDDYSKVKMT